MILITGAAGFIGSCLLQYMNEQGVENIILVDKFTDAVKEKNWKQKKYKHLVDRELLLDWLDENKPNIIFVIHLGARTNETETDQTVLQGLNTEYSEDVWNYCTAFNIPLIYASSAATYGNGELGYNDDDTMLGDLKPQDAYGISKHEFDKWAVRQLNMPPAWAGLKLFNVYGPNEYHKKHAPSEVLNAWKQVEKNGCIKLYKYHSDESTEEEQQHDFIYVKDVVKIIWWMYNAMTNHEWTPEKNGIYNIATGNACCFSDVAEAVFSALDKQPAITYIELPSANNTFHYAIEVSVVKLKHAGYHAPFTSLEEGVKDYVRNYLSPNKYY